VSVIRPWLPGTNHVEAVLVERAVELVEIGVIRRKPVPLPTAERGLERRRIHVVAQVAVPFRGPALVGRLEEHRVGRRIRNENAGRSSRVRIAATNAGSSVNSRIGA
jgi:hypothetical protein